MRCSICAGLGRAKKSIPNITTVMRADAGHVLISQQGRILPFLVS